ncbi:hypothetical protein HL653_11700 [Sphingomonas sp. AP4-R1]|uniref:hypothetical protein n=1 Tax=Sphingomonas sp. AP4-R1 TaxID=2735134 RepID=UPI001493CEEB|nr:hypothetical protein [Sphingomonas sp. AP4-R1]QJU58354.1 hypothetical protein HL653_11700 [Sphingomonas sp. AP4-R1]
MLRGLSAEIARTWISGQIQSHLWVVPAVQSVHILAIAALVFASFSANLAVVRSPQATRALPWLTSSYRWTWTALAILLVSGVILITGEPKRSLMNIFFRIKLVLVIVAAVLTVILQRSLTSANQDRLSRGTQIVLAAISITAWVAILFCGRFIAYFGDLSGGE